MKIAKPKRKLKKPASLYVIGVKAGMMLARTEPDKLLHTIFTTMYGKELIKEDIDDDIFLECVTELQEFETK